MGAATAGFEADTRIAATLEGDTLTLTPDPSGPYRVTRRPTGPGCHRPGPHPQRMVPPTLTAMTAPDPTRAARAEYATLTGELAKVDAQLHLTRTARDRARSSEYRRAETISGHVRNLRGSVLEDEYLDALGRAQGGEA